MKRLAALFVILLGFMAGASFGYRFPPTRNGVQRNIKLYLKAGVITQAQVDAVLGDIYQGSIQEIVIPKGSRGTNYYVNAKTGRLESVKNWVAKYDRKARVIGGLTWLVPCDNLLCLVKPARPCAAPAPKPTVRKVQVVVRETQPELKPVIVAQPGPRAELSGMGYQPPATPTLDVRESEAPFGFWWRNGKEAVKKNRFCPPLKPGDPRIPTPPPGNSPVFPKYPSHGGKWWKSQ